MPDLVCPQCRETYHARLTRPRLPVPAGLRKEERGSGVVYTWHPWREHPLLSLTRLLILGGLAVYWSDMLMPPAGLELSWRAVFFSRGRLLLDDSRPLLLVSLWSLLLLSALAHGSRLLRRARLEWTGHRLVGLVDLPVASIRQLYVARDGTLRCIGSDSAHQVLARGPLPVLKFLEQDLETRLDLDDVAVHNEFREDALTLQDPCPHCGAVMPAAEVRRQMLPEEMGFAPAQVGGEGLELQFAWKSTEDAGGVLKFALFWNALMSPVVGAGLHGILTGHLEKVSFFLLPHVWVGWIMLYYSLCLHRNSTRLTYRDGTLRLDCLPLKWPGYPKIIELGEVTQFYVVSYKVKSSTKYNLEGRRKDGSTVIVLANFEKPEPLAYVEQGLETHLGIVNQAMPGEWDRS